MRVHLEAYGCALSRGEALELEDALVERGCEMVANDGEADISIIFTCGVIETTERRMLRRLKELVDGPGELYVCGCLGDIAPESVREAAPDAYVFGAGEHWRALSNIPADPSRTVTDTPLQMNVTRTAPLPVANGCAGDCAYCVTRMARGPLKSRNIVEIKERVRALISKGAVELQLCAQDTAIYGQDIESNLLELVGELSSLEGDFMMRVGMMTPSGFLLEPRMVMEAFESPKTFKFLHLPVQSGSNRVLESMNRGYSVEDFTDIVRDFKGRWPDGVLATDIIVGFPGETEEDFGGSVALIKDVKPDIINVTRFSPRPGTAAVSMGGRVPGWVSKERSRALTELRFGISMQNSQRYGGTVVQALATERRKRGTTFLRDMNYRAIVVEEELWLGAWYRVRVTGAERTHLMARTEPAPGNP